MITEAEVKSTVEHQAKAAPLQFLDLGRQFEQIRDEVMRAVTSVLETQRFVLGPEVEQLEEEIAQYVGCRFAVACASGTDALILALMARRNQSWRRSDYHAVYLCRHRQRDRVCRSYSSFC